MPIHTTGCGFGVLPVQEGKVSVECYVSTQLRVVVYRAILQHSLAGMFCYPRPLTRLSVVVLTIFKLAFQMHLFSASA
jgi:hypothetical protein